MVNGFPIFDCVDETGFRLVNSKYPPIALFEDVANAEEFESLYQLQALTNPRLLNENGKLNTLPLDEIPFGITGCTYAVAPFTHINPMGSRFSDGTYGVLYLAENIETAVDEVKYHQNIYWSNIEGLKDDVMTFRGLKCKFDCPDMLDATTQTLQAKIYHPTDYSESQQLGNQIKSKPLLGIRYHSVRNQNYDCWGLFTPKGVKRIVQNSHYQFLWQSGITAVQKIKTI